jgi:hypothetical protein
MQKTLPKSEVLATVGIKIMMFRNVMPNSLVDIYEKFTGIDTTYV